MWSPLVRGAWIEKEMEMLTMMTNYVAPRERGVD